MPCLLVSNEMFITFYLTKPALFLIEYASKIPQANISAKLYLEFV